MSATTATSPATLPRARAWALALTATLTMSVSYVDRQALAAIAPSVQEALGISDADYGSLISAFALAYLVGAPLAGRLIDHVGARRGLLGAVLLWSGVAALHALVPSFAVLFALRILLGLTEAPSFPAAAQTVHRALPPRDRARGLGVLFTGSSIGAMIAPPLATFLASRFGFRAAFLGTAVVGLSWVPLWLIMAYEPRARRVLDQPHAAPRVEEGPPVSALALLRNPAVLRAVLAVIASAPFINLMFSWGTKYLVHDFHMTQKETGGYLWFPPLVFDAGSIAFGHFASRARSRGSDGVPRGLFAFAGSLMLAGLAMPLANDPLLSLGCASVALAGGGGVYAMATSDMLSRVSPRLLSTAGGITAAAQSIAQIIVNPIIGRSVQASSSYTPMILVLSAWVVPGVVAWVAWRPPPLYPDDDD